MWSNVGAHPPQLSGRTHFLGKLVPPTLTAGATVLSPLEPVLKLASQLQKELPDKTSEPFNVLGLVEHFTPSL